MKRCLYHLLILAVVLAAGLSDARAGDDIDKKIQELPKLLGSTNTGTEFYMTFLPAWPVAGGLNNIKIYVSAGVETEVIVEVKDDGFIQKKKTKPNDIIEFVLPVTTAQPYFKDDRGVTPLDAIYRQKAVRVIAKDPVICYGVTRYQYTSDGFLAIPVSGLGKEYQVASFSDVGDNGTGAGQYLPSMTSIVAPYNGTKVVFTLGGNLITRTAGGLRPGQSRTYNLNKGDVLSIASFGQSADLSGSTIIATKPVGVISGNYCAYIPETIAACDHICEMELPANTWGTAYHVTKIFGRQKNSLIKVFAKNPNTSIFKDGKKIGVISQAGGVEGTGYMFRRVDEGEPKSFIISADGPITITQHNPGQQDDNISSDPFQLVLTPIEQFQTEITFNTPGIGDGSGFARNYVNLVFQLDENKRIPDGLEFAVVENSKFEWTPVSVRFNGAFEEFAFDIDGKSYGMKTLLLPGDGVYKIRSPLPFAAYAYGFSDYDSYGFPTSVALGDLTTPDTNKPETEYPITCEACYKNITVTDKPDDESVRSNLALIYMDNSQSFNYDFSFDEFEAGESSSTRWSACPIDKSKDARAVLVFIDRAGNTRMDTLNYKAFNVAIAPEPRLDYGILKIGNSKVDKITVSNTSTENPITITRLEFTDAAAGFDLDPATYPNGEADLLPFTLDPVGGANNSRDIMIRFRATENSKEENNKLVPFRTDVVIGSDCGETSRTLEAIVAEPVIVVEDWDFKQVPIGTPIPKVLRIFNEGTAPLKVTGATGPTNAVYKVTDLPAYPFTIQPKQSQTFTVTFQPTAVQEYPDQIVFESDATGTDPICVLNGEAIKPGLAVTPYEWERLRVDLGARGTGTITVSNTGNQTVSIQQVNVKGDTDDFTVVNTASVIGDLAAGASKELTVEFHPTTIGPRSMEVEFISTAEGDPRVATLSGTGVYAKVVTQNYNFGTVRIGVDPVSVQDVEFTAVNDTYSDPIEITGLTLVEPAAAPYSYNIATNLFKDDGSQVTSFPVTLQKGEKLILRTVTFDPQTAGTFTRSMRADAVDDTRPDSVNNPKAISVWNGVGEVIPTGEGRVVALALDFQELCSNDSKVLTSTFGNPAPDAAITVHAIEIVQAGSQFSLGTLPDLPLELPANSADQFSVDVTYTPAGTGSHSAKLVFRDADGDILEEVDLNGSADEYATALLLSSDAQSPMVPGRPFTVTVKNPADIDALAKVQSMRLTITYDGAVAKATNVRAAGNYTIVGAIDQQWNSVSFTIAPTTPDVLPAGDMVLIDFRSFLAGSKTSKISVDVSDVQAQCLTVTGDEMDIVVGKICALDLRAVSTTGETFGISQNYPNPAADQTTIDLSIAFEVPATITLYNSMGEVVETLVSEQLQAGRYRLDLSTSQLPSGVYHYRVEAGPFVTTRQMVIAK